MDAESEERVPATVMDAALADVAAHKPPDTLYRFFKESARTSFTEGKLRLTPPDEFNDPFEIYAGLSEEGLTEEAVLRSLLNKNGLFRQALEANHPEYDLTGMGYEKKLIAAVKSDPAAWRLHLKVQAGAVASSCSNALGVSCFSAFSPEEFNGEIGIHHWAMYAGQHRGFAIGYKGAHAFLANCAEAKWFFPVEYVDRRLTVDISHFDEWNDEKMWRTIRAWSAVKSRRAWGHEKEWRLMLPINADNPMPGYSREILPDGTVGHFMNLWADSKSEEERNFRSSVIASVTLGARASDSLTDAVLAAARLPHLRHVEVWKVSASDRDYALVPKRIG